MRLWWEERRLGFVGLGFALAYTLHLDRDPAAHAARRSTTRSSTTRSGCGRTSSRSSRSARCASSSTSSRRYATARIGIRIEARMRELLYRAYLRYPRAFYDRHATGQVLSRATNDLYPIRYFIGWGLVQGMQSVMMIVGAGIVLVLVDAAARAVHGGGDAADHRARAPVRAPRLADLAAGAGAQGRRHRGGGRGRRRDRDGAGVRPRGRRARPLRRQGRGGPRHRAAPGRRRGTAPARASTTCRRSRSPRSCSSAASR